MKKFTFSLQRLLGYKEQLFDAERAILGEMQAALQAMIEELQEMQVKHKENSASLRKALQEGMVASEIEMHKTYLRMLEYQAVQKENQILLQRQAVEKQMDKVREAKIEISTMEKLREKKLEEYNYLANKKQEEFIEEYISTQRAMNPEQ